MVGLWGCSDNKELEGFGLPVIHIIIEPEEQAKMESTLTEKLTAAAELQVGDQYLQAKISYSGKSSLFHPKRNYEIKLRRELENYKVKNFRLSSQGSDVSSLRSLLGFQVFSSLGLLTPEQFPVALYINHRYRGLYQLIEDIDQDFFDKKSQTISQLYKARYGRLGHANFAIENLNDLSLGFKVVTGHNRYDPIEQLITLIHSEDFEPSQLKGILDTENYLNYLAAATFLNHWDGYNNNFFIYWDQQKLRFLPWDLDHIGEPSAYTEGSYRGKNELSKAILAFTDFEMEYQKILMALTEDDYRDNLYQSIQDNAQIIKKAYEKDPFLKQYDLDTQVSALISALESWQLSLREDIL